MRYTVEHVTRFVYEPPVSESVMEVRMQPRSDGVQRCLHFGLTTTPSARVLMYNDHDGNVVHHFNIPARHSRLTVTATALVECDTPPRVPFRLGPAAWTALDAMTASGEYSEWLEPSTFARDSALVDGFRREIGLDRGHCPLVTLRRLMAEMYKRFEYSPKTTRVDSPIDEALTKRQGVCQDFSHIFITVARSLGVPARYVSGYLFHRTEGSDRSAEGATHAWVEILMPEHGWVGLDPTNNLIAEDCHVRVALGRDYADVPPTKGVYKGATAVKTELAVSVRVGPVKVANTPEVPFVPWMSRDAGSTPRDQAVEQQQQ